jgi:hypothetical protein
MPPLSTSQSFRQKNLRLLTPVLIVVLLSCLPPPLLPVKTHESPMMLSDTTLVSLYIPLQKVTITVKDETESLLPPIISEAFFIEVANALVQYEVSRRFKVMPFPISDTQNFAPANTADSLLKTFRMKILADSGLLEKTGATIRSIASQCAVDLIILPLKASVKETLGKRGGWRSDKYGQSYERPVTCIAEASISLQIWDRNGKMVYKSNGKGASKQPLFYSLLKREKPKKEDLVHFSKNVFAPPLIRALSSAVKDIFPAQQPVSNRGRRF